MVDSTKYLCLEYQWYSKAFVWSTDYHIRKADKAFSSYLPVSLRFIYFVIAYACLSSFSFWNWIVV